MSITDEMILVAKELLTEFGFTATMKVFTSATLDPLTLSKTLVPGDDPTNVLACFYYPGKSHASVTLEDQSRESRQWMIIQSDTPVLAGNQLRVGTSTFYLVDECNPVGPQTTPVYYLAAVTQTK